MRARPPLGPATGLLLLIAALPLPPGEEDANPHAKAPRGVELVIHEPTQLLAAGLEYAEALFPRLSQQFPGRFSQDAEEVWVDAEGEYAYDDENECYWRTVGAEELSRGRQDFVQFCSSCHGLEGDGAGRSGQALRPPPRDFRQGVFKFTKTDAAMLPSDEALLELVQGGLDGTPMHPWKKVPESRLRDIITYVKSLSPEDSAWRDGTNDIAEPYDVGADPFAEDEAAGIAKGREIYHKRLCQSCHPGYVPAAELPKLLGDPAARYRPDFTVPVLKEDSSYAVHGYAVGILPPDFTWQPMRRGDTARDIALTVRAGIYGAGMPTWKENVISDEDVWALGHYVRSLVDTYYGRPAERAALMAGLRADP